MPMAFKKGVHCLRSTRKQVIENTQSASPMMDRYIKTTEGMPKKSLKCLNTKYNIKAVTPAPMPSMRKSFCGILTKRLMRFFTRTFIRFIIYRKSNIGELPIHHSYFQSEMSFSQGLFQIL